MIAYDGDAILWRYDLRANNSVVVLLNAQDQVIYQKRLPNNRPTILEALAPHLGEIEGFAQFISVCRASILAEKRRMPSPLSSPSLENKGALWRL